MTSVLQQVIARGTGTAAQLDRPAAGKTGTGEDYKNAWFCGYTPTLSTAVWVGYPETEVQMTPPTTSITVYGGTWPAQIWQRFMTAATAGTPPADFAPPETTTTTTTPAGDDDAHDGGDAGDGGARRPRAFGRRHVCGRGHEPAVPVRVRSRAGGQGPGGHRRHREVAVTPPRSDALPGRRRRVSAVDDRLGGQRRSRRQDVVLPQAGARSGWVR